MSRRIAAFRGNAAFRGKAAFRPDGPVAATASLRGGLPSRSKWIIEAYQGAKPETSESGIAAALLPGALTSTLRSRFSPSGPRVNAWENAWGSTQGEHALAIAIDKVSRVSSPVRIRLDESKTTAQVSIVNGK